jgi:hypothetical protein
MGGGRPAPQAEIHKPPHMEINYRTITSSVPLVSSSLPGELVQHAPIPAG